MKPDLEPCLTHLEAATTFAKPSLNVPGRGLAGKESSSGSPHDTHKKSNWSRAVHHITIEPPLEPSLCSPPFSNYWYQADGLE